MRAASQACAALDAPSTSGRYAWHQQQGGLLPRRRCVRGRAWTHNDLGLYNAAPLPARDYKPTASEGVVKGARTTATPLLTPDRVMQLLAETAHVHASTQFGAFYSSELGGIVTEPAYMVLSIDDHIVQAGDAVCETVQLTDGYLYQLDARLARFTASAELAGLPLPHSEARLQRILLDTAAASLKLHGTLHFWLSRGRGGLGFGETVGPAFYALLTTETTYADPDRDNGWRALSTPVAPRSAYFTTMRNTSQIESAVAHYEALSRGGDLAVFLDADDSVLYSSRGSLGILTRDCTLVLPPAEGGLAGMAVEVLAAHTMEYVSLEDEPDLPVGRIKRRLFTRSELADAHEAFSISSRLGVVGLSHFDDAPLGVGSRWEGMSGPASLALNQVLALQAQPKKQPGAAMPEHTEVPYGYLTGMKAQLQ